MVGKNNVCHTLSYNRVEEGFYTEKEGDIMCILPEMFTVKVSASKLIDVVVGDKIPLLFNGIVVGDCTVELIEEDIISLKCQKIVCMEC